MTEPISTHVVSLRPAQPEDEPFLVAVYGSTREQELAQVPWTNEQREVFVHFQATAQLRHYQTEYPKATDAIVLLDAQPVGRLYLDDREQELRILDFTLLPQHRGQGIGTPILRRLMTQAAQTGKSLSIYLDSFSSSQGLFERLGFVPTETSGFHTLFVWSTNS